MQSPEVARGLEFIPGSARPAVIAHGGGNTPRRAEYAISQGADWLEVDLWERNGHFEARHERRLGSLPLLFESWYIRRPGPKFELAALLEQTEGRARLLLDLKSGSDTTCDLIGRSIAIAQPSLPPVASSQVWSVLRRLRKVAPDVAVCYSIDVQAQLDLFFATVLREPVPDGVSCRHTLLTPEVVERMHELGIAPIAWTVDDGERGVELARLGVRAITTHRIADMRAALMQAQ
jgi:glycerophosphoryl diester phosphodiesterase